MEFVATIRGEKYSFSLLKINSFFVSGNNAEYILYKTDVWKCADEIGARLVEELGQVIDGYLQPS